MNGVNRWLCNMAALPATVYEPRSAFCTRGIRNSSAPAPLIMNWTRREGTGTPTARSSHAVSKVGTKLYVVGGEHVARMPIDNTVHMLEMAR